MFGGIRNCLAYFTNELNYTAGFPPTRSCKSPNPTLTFPMPPLQKKGSAMDLISVARAECIVDDNNIK